jgi:hypothetical protein
MTGTKFLAGKAGIRPQRPDAEKACTLALLIQELLH